MTRRVLIAAGFVFGLALAGPVMGQERITQELWLDAQAHAARLAEIEGYDAHSVHIMMTSIARVRAIAGDRSANACVFVGEWRILYCRKDRPWQSDRGHAFGILVHEGMHSLQDERMSRDCRERQAHDVQIRWLRERGEYDLAAEVAANAPRYRCAANNR